MAKSLLQISIWMSTGDLRAEGSPPAAIHGPIKSGIPAPIGETGMKAITSNLLLYGDNLQILREHPREYDRQGD